MQSKKQKFEQLIKSITIKYQQLKNAINPSQRFSISTELITLCTSAQKQLDLQPPSSKLFRHKTHIINIKNKAIQVQKQNQLIIQRGGKNKYDMMISSANIVVKNQKNISEIELQQKYKYKSKSKDKQNEKQKQKQKDSLNQKQLSKRICLYIAQKQINSKQLKVSAKQYEKLAQRMQKNLQVMNEIKSIIDQQGNDIDYVKQKIDDAYDNTVKGNQKLQDAADIQMKTRLTKIRLGLTGIFAAIGYGILGIPGLIAGGVAGIYRIFT